ncbi:ACC synthase [Aspergillus pseudocaelatus]|uniref:ACC synthase n=1 Tax=Aspergillus pseudocaelatus TaxID=1825620 RepID=A0ABQ6WUJ7_9EURO|nr:ACC synthase [Aspergillus pseudocaelatus]
METRTMTLTKPMGPTMDWTGTQPLSALSNRAQTSVATCPGSVVRHADKDDDYHPDTNPQGLCELDVAENLLMRDHLLQHIERHYPVRLSSQSLTYPNGGAGSQRLKAAMARFLNRSWNPIRAIEPRHLILTNGVSTALEQLAWGLLDPGDGILLAQPYYGNLIAHVSLRVGATVVPVSFEPSIDPFSLSAVSAYRLALTTWEQTTGKRVRAILLCHPHNPLGRCYAPNMIKALMQLCQEHQMHLISDEIYSLSEWENPIDNVPPNPFQSVTTINTDGIIDPHRVHVLWGLSKDFGANGLRVAAIVSQSNRQLHSALGRLSWYSFVAGPSDMAATSLLEDDEFTTHYLQLNSQRMRVAFVTAARSLKENRIPYRPGPHAGVFLWIDLGTRFCELHPREKSVGLLDLNREISERLEAQKVMLAPGELFGAQTPGWFRLVFTHPEWYLEEALRRIVVALS